MGFQQSEVVCLFLALAFGIPAAFMAATTVVPRAGWFFTAVFLAISAAIFTVVEDVVYPDAMNLLEHACYAASAVFFAAGCWLLKGDLGRQDGRR